MEKETFKLYCDKVARMNERFPNWYERANSIISDYLRESTTYGYGNVLYNLLAPAHNLIKQETDMHPADSRVLDVYELAAHLSVSCKEENYRFSAYLFAVCVAAAAFFGLTIDDSVCDEFDENELMNFNSAVSVMNETDPYKRQLIRYGIRLLDFSRNNQLVHFRQLKSSTMGLLVRDTHATLKNIMSAKAKIYLSGWRNLAPKMIYRCKVCGRVESFSYEFSAKKDQPARPCPICDANNTHNRKSLEHIKEKLICLPGDEYICSCGAAISVADFEGVGYRCSKCGKYIMPGSAPVISAADLMKIDKNEIFCTVGDVAAKETLRGLMTKSNNLERNFGLHVLYLAYGFLRWRDTNGTEYNSPMLLCPINLSADTSRDKYYFETDPSASGHVFEVNKTLIQMLASYSRTCSITLPELNENDIHSYFTLVRDSFLNADDNIRAIVKDWKIERQFSVGLFHYQKLQLHHDMETNADKYLEHPIIRRLCGDSAAEIEQTTRIDRPSMKYMLLDADSSQEEVIRRAQEGQSFILQGPPGSGKSQTITNIIANALGAGKTVLFVTEKASARSVIMDNLQRCHVSGDKKLTEFVLDFDSFKKRSGAIGREPFVNELNRCIVPYSPTGGYDDSLFVDEELSYKKIGQFMREMHGEYGGRNYLRLLNDMAPYAGYEKLHVSADLVPTDMTKFTKLYDMLDKYYVVAADCPAGIDYKDGVLCGCKGDNGDTLYNAAVSYSSACDQIEDCVATLKSFGWSVISDKGLLKECVTMLKRWADLPAFTKQILEDISVKKLDDLITRAERRMLLVTLLSQHPGINYVGKVVHDKGMALDTASLAIQGKKYSLFFKRLSKKYQAWRESIFGCFKSAPAGTKYADVLSALDMIAQYKDYHEKSESNLRQRSEDINLFGYEPANAEAWGKLIDDLNAAKAILADNNIEILDLDSDPSWALRFERSAYASTRADIISLAESLKKAIDSEECEGNKIASYFRMDVSGSHYPYYATTAHEIVDNRRCLAPLHRLDLLLSELQVNGWSPVLDELIDEKEGDFATAKCRLFKTYYINVINAFINDNQLEAIRDFTRSGHEKLLARYGEIEKQLLSSGAKRIYETLKAYLKEAASHRPGGSLGTYPKLQSKTHYSIKRTISENWDYISHIKPCFMMSPLNVSQYIDIGINFDIVIFDEASQIFTEDALASIVRGRQVIIAGDSKQLPPCDFFRAGDSSQDDEDTYYDEDSNNEYSLLTTADSVLPDASVSLMWHYRSSDESLIHFANQAMDYNLITFPSAKHDCDDGVELVRVAYSPVRCYEAGKGKEHINRAEVDAIVERIYAEMTHPTRRKFSIGVVAFSNAQAFEIESEWEKFKQKPENKDSIEKWEDEHKEEPLIFCNLDTVQGDERDTTIISVCYSKDASGKFILPYLGRIRLESGKKRINVAVTRARHRMIVFSMLDESTLRDAINSSAAPENNKEGARMLLDFIGYADSHGGKRRTVSGETESEIAKSVCSVLDENGIAYDCEVGMSECKISIAVVRDRHSSGDYCFGIIIDDPGRVDFDSVREYSRLTEQILSNKYGWKLYRVFPISWINDYENEKAMLLENIRNAMA